MKKIIKSSLNLFLIIGYVILILMGVLITMLYFSSIISNDKGRIWKTILFLLVLNGFFVRIPKAINEKFKIKSWTLFFSSKNASLRTFVLFPFLMPFALWNGIGLMNHLYRGFEYKSYLIYTIIFFGILIANIFISIISVYRASEKTIAIERDNKVNDIFELLRSRDINQESYITWCPSCAAIDILDLGKSKPCQYCNAIIVREVLNNEK